MFSINNKRNDDNLKLVEKKVEPRDTDPEGKYETQSMDVGSDRGSSVIGFTRVPNYSLTDTRESYNLK